MSASSSSAVSHWRGNVEWRTVRLMTLPGFVGAFLGAVALSSLSAETAEPWMAGFLFSLGSERIEMAWVAALLAGGVIAAPLAAWIVRKLPPRILGSAVGSVILVTNAKTIVEAAGLAETASVVAYVAIVSISLALLARAVVTLRVQPSQ